METIELNGKKYYSEKPQAYSPTEYKVVRSYAAGVFYGVIESRQDSKSGLSVIMKDARRIYYWSGASTLSQLSAEGVKRPLECKFPQKVDRVELMNVVEILDLTEEAKESLDAVAIWKQ